MQPLKRWLWAPLETGVKIFGSLYAIFFLIIIIGTTTDSFHQFLIEVYRQIVILDPAYVEEFTEEGFVTAVLFGIRLPCIVEIIVDVLVVFGARTRNIGLLWPFLIYQPLIWIYCLTEILTWPVIVVCWLIIDVHNWLAVFSLRKEILSAPSEYATGYQA